MAEAHPVDSPRIANPSREAGSRDEPSLYRTVVRAAGRRPCGSMAVVKRLIIADAHVGQRTDDVADMVSMLLNARDSGVTEIIYLGDGFQYLIGMSKFWTAGVIEVIETWRLLRRSVSGSG